MADIIGLTDEGLLTSDAFDFWDQPKAAALFQKISGPPPDGAGAHAYNPETSQLLISDSADFNEISTLTIPLDEEGKVNVYLGIVEGNHTVEESLYDNDAFKNPATHSPAFKNNGFLTLYYLVRTTVDMGVPFNTENVLKSVLGDKYEQFTTTSITDASSATLSFEIDISTISVNFEPIDEPDIPAPRTISHLDFVAFISKYPHVYTLGQDRINALQLLTENDGPPNSTTLITVESDEFKPSEVSRWQPIQKSQATHYVYFGTPGTPDVDDKYATMRTGYIKTTNNNSSITKKQDIFEASTGNYAIFKGAPIIGRLPNGAQVQVVREGFGKGALFSQFKLKYYPKNHEHTFIKSGYPKFIDSRTLMPFGNVSEKTNEEFDFLTIPKIEVPEPDPNFIEPDWTQKDDCEPWLNEKTNEYCIMYEHRGKNLPGTSDKEMIRRKGVIRLLSYYDKKRSPGFVDKLLELNNGLFARIVEESSSSRKDKTYKFLIGIPRTYFEHPFLDVNPYRIDNPSLEKLSTEHKKIDYWWVIKTNKIEKWIDDTIRVVSRDFKKRLSKANSQLDPKFIVNMEVENLKKFLPALKEFMFLNDATLQTDRADGLIFGFDFRHRLKMVLYQQTNYEPPNKKLVVMSKKKSKSGRQKTQEGPSRYLGISLPCFRNPNKNPGCSPRTLAYLRFGQDMQSAVESDKYPGLELVLKYTIGPEISLFPSAPKKQEEGLSSEEISDKVQTIFDNKPKSGDKTIKTEKELKEETKKLINPAKRAKTYNSRKDVRINNFDTALSEMEKIFDGAVDSKGYYKRILNIIDIKNLISVAYTCLGKVLPVNDLKALIRKNVLKTIGYENLKAFVEILAEKKYLEEVCPNLIPFGVDPNTTTAASANFGEEGTPPPGLTDTKVSEDDEEAAAPKGLMEVVNDAIKSIEDDYLCYSNGEIKSALGPDFSKSIESLDNIPADLKNANIYAAAKQDADFRTKQQEKLLQELNVRLVDKLDHEGVLNCILKILDKYRDELEETLIAILSPPVPAILIRKLLHPEDFLNDILGQIRLFDPEGTIHRIENYTPTFEIPEAPRGHDDPLAQLDRALDQAFLLIASTIGGLVKTVIDEFLKLCEGANIVAAIESLTEKDNIENSIKPGLGTLPESTLDMSPWQLKKLKIFDRIGSAPSSLSGLQSNHPGELNIYDLLSDPSIDGEIFFNILEKMGKLPTSELMGESLNLLDELSRILKPSEICSIMLGEANEVIYKLIFKVIQATDLDGVSPSGYVYPNLRTVFDYTTEVKTFFLLLGSYIDLTFCSSVVSNIGVIIGSCERNLEDDWYCEQLKQKGYSEEDCKSILASKLNRDRKRLEHLGDLLMASDMTDLLGIPPLVSSFGRKGIISETPPYVQEITDKATDSLLDMARARFDLESRGLKGIFVDEVFIEGGDTDPEHKRMPEEGRDYIGESWAAIYGQVMCGDNYCNSNVPTSHPDAMKYYNNTWVSKGYKITDSSTWPQRDITVRKVAESLKLNLLLDNSNIQRYGPVNIYPNHFNGIEENEHNTTLEASNVPAKEHYTIINYHKMLESPFVRYKTVPAIGYHSISWEEHEAWYTSQDITWYTDNTPAGFNVISSTDPYAFMSMEAFMTETTAIMDFIGYDYDNSTTFNESFLRYGYEVVVPVISSASLAPLQQFKSKFPKSTAKLIEFAYPKYIQIKAQDFITKIPDLPIPFEIATSISNYPIDIMELRIYDRSSEFTNLNTQLAQSSDDTGDYPTFSIPLENITGDQNTVNLTEAADQLRDEILGSDEGVLDITDIDTAKILSYQQWLFSALFTDSFGSLIHEFDDIGDSTINRRRKFMKSCMKIYDLAFTNGVTNILTQVSTSPMFNIDVFDRLILSGKASLRELEDIICNEFSTSASTPPTLSDLLNTDSLKDLARLMTRDQECVEGAFEKALERIAVLAYIRVVLLENILRGLLIFTAVRPVDLLKDNLIFLKYMVYSIKSSTMRHSDIYFEKILNICLDMVLFDIGCSFGSTPITVLDKTIVFEDINDIYDYETDIKVNKKYNLQWVLEDPVGKNYLPELKETCLIYIIQQQIEEIDGPVSEILKISGIDYEKLELKNAILSMQRETNGKLLEDYWYSDLPLNLIDYDFYKPNNLVYEEVKYNVDVPTYIEELFGVPWEEDGESGFSGPYVMNPATEENTYFPAKLYHTFPLLHEVNEEIDEQDQLGSTVDINIDALDSLFDRYEELNINWEEDLIIGDNKINAGAFRSSIRKQNRSNFYKEPPATSVQGNQDTQTETGVQYSYITWAQLATFLDPIIQTAAAEGIIEPLEENDWGPGGVGGMISLTKWRDHHFGDWGTFVAAFGLASLGAAPYDFPPPDETLPGIKIPTAIWEQNSGVLFAKNIGDPDPSFADGDDFIEQLLGYNKAFSNKLTPLGAATKNGGFVIQRYLKLKLNKNKETFLFHFTDETGDESWLNWKLAFNFGFDGGTQYNINPAKSVLSLEGLADPNAEGGALFLSPQSQEIFNSGATQIVSDYYEVWYSQGHSYFSTKALDYAMLNSVLFSMIHLSGENITDSTLGTAYGDFITAPCITGIINPPDEANSGGGPGGDESETEWCAEWSADPTYGFFDHVKAGTYANRPLSDWFEDITIGQRLVYVFPHDLDVTKSPLDQLPPEIAVLVESEGLFNILETEDTLVHEQEAVLESWQIVSDAQGNGADILNTTYEMGPNHPGSFAKILRKNLTAEAEGIYSGDSENPYKFGTAGESLKEEMFSSRYLRQQEMVIEPNTSNIGLKRIYSLPIKGCFAEYSAKELLDTTYGQFVKYYAEKQGEIEKIQIEAGATPEKPYSFWTGLQDKVALEKLCKDYVTQDVLEVLLEEPPPGTYGTQEQQDLYKDCLGKIAMIKMKQIPGFVDNFCKITEMIMPSSLGADTKLGTLDEYLTEQLFNTEKGKLLSKYILSEDVIKNLALLHTIFFPVEPAVGMNNLFVSTKELLYNLGDSAGQYIDDYSYNGTSDFQQKGGNIGINKSALDRISTSKADNAIVSFFQNLTPKLILKGFVQTTDPAWKRAFQIQGLTGVSDKYLPGIMAAIRPIPLIPPPFGDPSAPITPFGMVYLGLSALEPLSENHNANNPIIPDTGIDVTVCESDDPQDSADES